MQNCYDGLRNRDQSDATIHCMSLPSAVEEALTDTPALNPLIVSDLKSISLSWVFKGFGLKTRSSVCLKVMDLSSDV